jgi:hypothetical protein
LTARKENVAMGKALIGLLAALIATSPATLHAQPRKKAIPVIKPEEKKPDPPVATSSAGSSESGALFEEIEFGNTLVIEGKVEKPQVQFTLLKEPPPEKEIRFETSFLSNILKQERENTFDARERFGRE